MIENVYGNTLFQIGKSTPKRLIAFLACHNVTHSFISLGQLLQTSRADDVI